MNSTTVTVKVSNEFAGGSNLEIYHCGEGIEPIDLVQVILPYLTRSSAWSVLSKNAEVDLCSNRYNQVITSVDFTGHPSLVTAPEDPEEWLNALESKCRLVHEAFKAEYPRREHTVTRDITIYA